MKYENMICLRSVNILLILGSTVALLVSTSSSQMILASVEGGAPGPNTSIPNQGASESADSCRTDPNRCKQPTNSEQSLGGSQGGYPNLGNSDASNSNQEVIEHINQAQFALQNGDNQGAQMHMDLAKQALICNLGDPAHC